MYFYIPPSRWFAHNDEVLWCFDVSTFSRQLQLLVLNFYMARAERWSAPPFWPGAPTWRGMIFSLQKWAEPSADRWSFQVSISLSSPRTNWGMIQFDEHTFLDVPPTHLKHMLVTLDPKPPTSQLLSVNSHSSTYRVVFFHPSSPCIFRHFLGATAITPHWNKPVVRGTTLCRNIGPKKATAGEVSPAEK